MKRLLTSFSSNHPLICSFILCLLFFILLGIFFIPAEMLFGKNLENYDYTGYLAVSVAGQLLLSILLIIVIRWTGLSKSEIYGRQGFARGLLIGWYGLLFAMLSFGSNLIGLPAEYLTWPQMLPLSVVILSAFFTGFFEETLVRGLVLGILNRRFGDNKGGIVISAIVSSLLFGAAHLLNILTGSAVIETLVQVVYATMIGVFFAALYLRTNNLWVLIFLHALIDLASFLFLVIVTPEGMKAISEQAIGFDAGLSSLVTLLVALPFLLIGLVLLRKVQPRAALPQET
ncbi:MAG: CPBP family intramembrane metalloprotease [Coriobacteriales bacterium]|jgi:membrane protease YdiL (CAAX protease family)|nr:CPBP family intramembrane metalloprotease [Coriobacteriales bacterium]